MSDLLLIIGVFLLSLSLRTMASAILRKVGGIGFFFASYLLGAWATGSWIGGLGFASFWLLWPWYELITRVRKITLPVNATLRHRNPPHADFFPALAELTQEIQDEGFEHLDDLGRDWDNSRQYFRIFHHPRERIQAAICMMEEENLAFYYLRITAHADDGRVWMTWNYPFSLNLKLAPHWRIQWRDGGKTFLQLLDTQRAFLREQHVSTDALRPTDPERLIEDLHAEQAAQITHNLTAGILHRERDGGVRYTWRGLLYLWLQFLRGLLRLD